MLPEKRFKYVKGLLEVATKAMEGYRISKEQFEEMFPTNKKLWESLTSFETVEEAAVVPVEEPKSEETPDANV